MSKSSRQPQALLTFLTVLLATLIPARAAVGLSEQPRGECGCVAPGDPGFETGLVWQGDHTLGLEEIATILAPMLWFSSDELLLLARR